MVTRTTTAGPRSAFGSGPGERVDEGTRSHFQRLGVGPGRRCIEIGAGGGAVALWLAEMVAPNGKVIATDLELTSLGRGGPIRRWRSCDTTSPPKTCRLGSISCTQALADRVAARQGQALRRMVAALRRGGVLLDEEPDFVTVYEMAEPPRSAT